MFDYEDVPMVASAHGLEMYLEGQSLVREEGVRLDQLIWDADEVLWDWVMDAALMLRSAPAWVRKRDLSHREYFLAKAGVFELLWGMRHASLELGLDPHMRIWTNGYPWRIWKILSEIPGFSALLGAPDEGGPMSREELRTHPRLFSRLDYVVVARRLLGEEGAALLEGLEPGVGEFISRHLRECPHDSSLKLPELAQFCSKDGFSRARVLIDDQPSNIARFLSTGRQGVRVVTGGPRVFKRLMNVSWRPRRHLLRHSKALAPGLAQALRSFSSDEQRRHIQVLSGALRSEENSRLFFSLEIPDEVLRGEWLDPVRPLRLSK